MKGGLAISLIDKCKAIWFLFRRMSTRQLINVKDIQDYAIELQNGDTLLYYRVQPQNINTLPESVIKERIYSLMNIIKTVKDIEISCFNTSENFGAVQKFYKARIAEENQNEVRNLLAYDCDHLDQIKQELSTAKEFLLIVRFNLREKDQIPIASGRIEKIIKDNGLYPKLLKKEDLKHMLAVYFEQDTRGVEREDYSGERSVANTQQL